MEPGLWFHVLGRVIQTKFQFWSSNSGPVRSQLVLINPDLNDRPIRNTEPQSGPIYYTRFWSCTPLFPFTSHGTVDEFGAEKPISWAKLAHFHPLAINFTGWSHILSTFGDALRSHPRGQGSSLHTEGIMYYWPSTGCQLWLLVSWKASPVGRAITGT